MKANQLFGNATKFKYFQMVITKIVWDEVEQIKFRECVLPFISVCLSFFLSTVYLHKDLSLDAFIATECNEIFSTREPHQDMKVSQCFSDWLHLLLCVSGGLVEPKLMTRYPTPSNHPEDRDRVCFWTSENFHILVRFSARENFGEQKDWCIND